MVRAKDGAGFGRYEVVVPVRARDVKRMRHTPLRNTKCGLASGKRALVLGWVSQEAGADATWALFCGRCCCSNAVHGTLYVCASWV